MTIGLEEATRQTAENLGCTPEQLNNAINHFKKIDEAKANEPKEKLDEIIKGLKEMSLGLGAGSDRDYFIHEELEEHVEKLEKFRDEEL